VFTVSGGPVRGQSVALAPNFSVSVNLREEFTAPADNEMASGVAEVEQGMPRPRRYAWLWLESADEFNRQPGAGLRPPAGPDDESLVLENVSPGRYWVRVNSSRGYVATMRCGETDLLRHPLVVSEGGSAPIEVTVRDDSAQLEGAIENFSPLALSTASFLMPQVYLIPLPESTGQFQQVWVSPSGQFAANQVVPGDYQVLAFDRVQPELEYRDDAAMSKYHDVEQVVRFLPGQKERVTLRVISGSEP